MKRFRNILAVVDKMRRDDVFLYRAASLAAANNGKLKVVGVIETIPDTLTKKLEAQFQVNIEMLIREEKLKQFRCIESRYQRLLPVTTKLLVGTPFIEIIREVIRGNHDLVVIQAALAGKKKGLFGSTELHLLRKCPCPVWIFRRAETDRFKRILAAVNVNTSVPEEVELNRKILELSYALAKIDQSEFHVLHCWSVIGEGTLRARDGSRAYINDYVREVRSNVASKLNECVAPFSSTETPNIHVHLLKGAADILVPDLVRRKHIGLLVMGTVARSGISGLLIGNTAEKIVNEVACSLLAIKATGFVCPIEA